MSSSPIAVLRTGLVTSVGLTAASSCAAIRARLANPGETLFIDSAGEWIVGHSVPLERPWSGRAKLVKMAVRAIEQVLEGTPREDWGAIPLLLCVAEPERPGRIEMLDAEVFASIQSELRVKFAPDSQVIAQGHVSVASALSLARSLMQRSAVSRVLIAAADSLLSGPTLDAYERADRLLTARNSNGFLPGEGGAALLVGSGTGSRPQELLVCGVGSAREGATLEAAEPLRGEGLALAIRAALQDAGCGLEEVDFRVTDSSGEQYYAKEAALAMLRLLRVRKEEFDIWHPAECIGEAGAVTGLAALIVAEAACRKAYAPGPGILCHMANDAGERAALVLRYRVS
jgi:3-oxoacyl-[acyl-carrier-protein] synthase-1